MLDQYGEKKLRLDPDLFRPSFYTFLCILVSSKAAQFKTSNRMQVAIPLWWKQRVTKKPRKMMKKRKSMTAEAAAVRRLVLLSDEDDELNVQEEWVCYEEKNSDDF